MVPHKVRCPMQAWLPNAGVLATKVVVNRGRVAMLLALGRGAFGEPHLRGRAVQTARLEVFAIVAKHSENAIRAAGPTTFGLARLRLLGT